MESIGQNTKLFNLPENKIFFSLGILLLKELPLIDDQKQNDDQIRTISLENFIYCAHVDGQEDEIEDVHPIGCRCRANDKNDPVQRKYIRFFVTIKDLEKAIDDEDNSESTQIFIPLEWKSCAKSFAFVEFIGRQIFGHIYKCIEITVPRSADIDSGIEILALLNELIEHINTVNKLVNYNYEDGTAAAEENEYGCNSEYLGILFSNCKQKAAQELELLGKLLAKNYVINLDKWPIVDNSRFGYRNGMKKELEILYSSMDPPELLIDACFKAPIKFKSFRFLYCIGNLSKFVEKLIEYFLYEKAETIMPESVIIEQFDPKILADWPPQCLAICDEQLSSAAENMERKNQIHRKEGITLAVKCEYLQYSLLPNAKFIFCNESMKKEFIMNIWFRSKNWTINPKKIYIYQTNPINTN